MLTTQKTAICLMKSAITGQPEVLPEGHDMRDTLKLMLNQGIKTMGYVGAVNCGVSTESPMMTHLLDEYCCAVVQSELQVEQIRCISQAFEEKGIDYMPVKGSIMKHMYPSHELRGMSDADILIREEEYQRIRPVMESLGYTETGESDHEHIWQHEHLKVELHKCLIPSYNKDYYSYFGEGWDLAEVQNGHCWTMTDENAYIYDFIHFAKHYRDGDPNCRFVTDLWIHKRCHPNLDMAYIQKRIDQMRMGQFYENVLRVIDAWFENGPWDEMVTRITQVLFCPGPEERRKNNAVAQSVRLVQESGTSKNRKSIQLLHWIFPKRETMNWSYPQWKKKPLVIAWVLRWCDLLFRRKDVIRDRSREISQISEQDVENYRQDLEYVGLQFSDQVALPD